MRLVLLILAAVAVFYIWDNVANAPPTRSALIYNARERLRASVQSYSFQTLP
ncbi:hypothetical protein NKI32_24640 [Mesorhizobium sp. M0761]|uniref:hypothetical protein n=1 Tax=Mesorhizobium sp. M0761 TaxID=2956994 RepID=UPI00333BC8CB